MLCSLNLVAIYCWLRVNTVYISCQQLSIICALCTLLYSQQPSCARLRNKKSRISGVLRRVSSKSVLGFGCVSTVFRCNIFELYAPFSTYSSLQPSCATKKVEFREFFADVAATQIGLRLCTDCISEVRRGRMGQDGRLMGGDGMQMAI